MTRSREWRVESGEQNRPALDSPLSAPGSPLTVFTALRDKHIRVSWKREVRRELHQLFIGREYTPVLEACDRIHKEVLKSRVFVALHMHAGDGNVHTNIPSNSDE